MSPAKLVRTGRVVAVDQAVMKIAFTTPCQSCRSGCLLGHGQERRVSLPVSAEERPNMGERVEIAVARSDLTRLCAVLFGIPLLAFLGGGVIGSQVWGEQTGVLLGLLMLAGALAWVRAPRSTLRYRVKLELIALRGAARVG